MREWRGDDLWGKIDDEPGLARALTYVQRFLIINATFQILWSISVARAHPSAAVLILVGVPVYLVAALQLVRLRTRAVSVLLVTFGFLGTVNAPGEFVLLDYRIPTSITLLRAVQSLLELWSGFVTGHALTRWRNARGETLEPEVLFAFLARTVAWGLALMVAGAITLFLLSLNGGVSPESSALISGVVQGGFFLSVLLSTVPNSFGLRPVSGNTPWPPASQDVYPPGPAPYPAAPSPAPSPAPYPPPAPHPSAAYAPAVPSRPPHPHVPSTDLAEDLLADLELPPLELPDPDPPPLPTAALVPRRPTALSAPPALTAAERREVRRTANRVLVGVGVFVALGAAFVLRPRTIPPPSQVTEEALNTPVPPPEKQAPAPVAPPRHAVPDADLPYGGQPIGWWTHTGTSSPVIERRARANRLERRLGSWVAAPERVDARMATGTKAWASSASVAEGRAAVAALARKVEERVARIAAVPPAPGRPRLFLAPSEGPRAALRLVFPLPVAPDHDSAVLDRLTLHAVLVASGQRDAAALADDVADLDGTLELDQTPTQVAVTLVAATADFDALAARTLRIFLAPRLVEAALPAARKSRVGAQDIGDVRSISGLVESVILGWRGFEELSASHLDQLRQLEAGEVRRRMASVFAPGNAVIASTGAFDVGRLRAAVAAVPDAGSSLAANPGERSLAGVHRRRSFRSLRVVAYPLAIDTPDARARALLAAAVLEERLFTRVRGEGRAYAVECSLDRLGGRDALAVAVPAALASTSHVARLVDAEVGALVETPLDGPTLTRNQAHVLHTLLRRAQEPEALSRALATVASIGDASPGVAAAVAALGPRALQETLGGQLVPTRAITVELSPELDSARREDRR